MLIFGRKAGERVVIDDSIIITVIEIRDDRVRLGFEAPSHIEIHRKEVWADIQKNGTRTDR